MSVDANSRRYVGRHGKRLSKTGLGGGGTPTDAEDIHDPRGTPLEAFDGIRTGVTADRAQVFADVAKPYFSANRAGAKVSQGTLDWFWFKATQASLKGTLDCIKGFTEDLKKFDVPTLIRSDRADWCRGPRLGEDRQELQPQDLSRCAARAQATHKDKVNVDLLSFLKS